MQIQNRKTLVTGGAGFIGSHLVDELAKENDVLVMDNFSVGKKENLSQHRDNNRVKKVDADVRDKEKMRELLKGIDIVYHLATQCVRVSIHNPELVHEVNSKGTLNLCLASLENEVERFVYVSSSEAYGTAQTVPMTESHPCEPTTIYGASKLAGEYYAKAFFRTYDLPIIIVRPFNTYGPRAHFEGAYGEVIPKFALRVLNGVPPVIFGDGTQTRDFTYTSDTVRGIVLASTCDALVGDVVNIAYGKEVSIKELADIIIESIGRTDLKPIYGKSRPGDVKRHYADITKARQMLGFEPQVNIRDGILKYIEWFKTSHPDLEKCLTQEEMYNWATLRKKGNSQ